MTEFIHGGNVWGDNKPENWIDFSANLNPKGPPKIMMEEIKENIHKIVYYPEINLKVPTENIANYLKVPSNNILPTNGGIGALSLIADNIRPEKVMILQPGFVEYSRIAQNINAEIINIPIIENYYNVVYDSKKIIKKLDDKTLLFICNPVNPIGSTMPMEILHDIILKADKKGAKVVVDEAFIEFTEGNSVKKYVEKFESLIIAGSLTKIFAIPGIRIGYICTNSKLVKKFKNHQTPWNLSSFAYDITNSLDRIQGYVHDTIEENEVQKKYLEEEISKLGIYVFKSKANFLLLNMREKNIRVKELQEHLLRYKILIRDCSNYRYLDDYYTRIAIKSFNDNKNFIEKLKEFV